MPRFTPKGTLERTAVADLWKHTLSGIASVFGRLICLAGLRDPNSGRYRHYGLSTVFGREESSAALRESHYWTFHDWLSLTLPEKSADLADYLAGLDEIAERVAANWLRGAFLDSLTPDAASPAQRAHFRQELEFLLELIQNEAGAAVSPDSSLRA
jgi:hypothetical protein